MAQCELTETCIFFNNKMSNMPSTAETYKRVFCLSEYQGCARYMVYSALGRIHVPADLFPSQKDVAESLIAKYRP